MGVTFLSISVVCTIVSFIGLQCWMEISTEKYQIDGLIFEDFIHSENVRRVWDLLLASYITLALVASFALNVVIMIILCLKTIFFSELNSSEIRKLVERLLNYVVYKGTFLPLVVSATISQAGLWSTWLAVLCLLKMFQALARERLECLDTSPSATPWTYLRVYSALLLVLFVDLLWVSACITTYGTISSSAFFLLFFEPLSIGFETLQAIMVHGFQLLEIFLHHSAGDKANFRVMKLANISPIGSLREWKGILIPNLGFFFDVMTLLMALAHYLYIWWLHGMALRLLDAILFLNIRALLGAIVQRVKGFIKLRIALATLDGAFPDATSKELRAYNDECAICREPMAKAKKLSCNHLFHLACLRSWLDQGLHGNYSCPNCWRPLFASRPENRVTARVRELSTDELLARQMSAGLDRSNSPGHHMHSGIFSNLAQNAESDDWRRAGDSSWLHSDEAGTSGLGRVQMVVRQLAGVGETYAQTSPEDLFPTSPSQAGASRSPTPRGSGDLHFRSTFPSANENLANMLSMVETVHEVLPHVPDDIIFQDLQRTNSATVTVNNLLQVRN